VGIDGKRESTLAADMRHHTFHNGCKEVAAIRGEPLQENWT